MYCIVERFCNLQGGLISVFRGEWHIILELSRNNRHFGIKGLFRAGHMLLWSVLATCDIVG